MRDPKMVLEEIAYKASSVRREYDIPIPIEVVNTTIEYIDERLSELCQIVQEIQDAQK